MKFSIKSAGQYSNKLSSLIRDLSFGYSMDNEGLVKITETHKKSQIKMGDLNTELVDEEKEIKPRNKIDQVDPMIRIALIEELIEEKNKVDYTINSEKSKISLVSPITKQTIGIDLALKENSLYRNTLMNTTYPQLLDVESSETESKGREQTIIDGKEIILNYTIITKKESLVDNKVINAKYLELAEKLREESDEIDRLQASTTFEFDNKFGLYDSRENLIEKYNKN